jgi:hypothetical protein
VISSMNEPCADPAEAEAAAPLPRKPLPKKLAAGESTAAQEQVRSPEMQIRRYGSGGRGSLNVGASL